MVNGARAICNALPDCAYLVSGQHSSCFQRTTYSSHQRTWPLPRLPRLQPLLDHCPAASFSNRCWLPLEARITTCPNGSKEGTLRTGLEPGKSEASSQLAGFECRPRELPSLNHVSQRSLGGGQNYPCLNHSSPDVAMCILGCCIRFYFQKGFCGSYHVYMSL